MSDNATDFIEKGEMYNELLKAANDEVKKNSKPPPEPPIPSMDTIGVDVEEDPSTPGIDSIKKFDISKKTVEQEKKVITA